jgi:hypothetical protein
MGVLIPYKEEEMGIPICTLTWNPVIQQHKNTNVRFVLDYTIRNPFIGDENFVVRARCVP